MSTCVGEHTLLRYVEGALPEEARGPVDAHIDTCPACRELVAQVARARETVSGPRIDEPGERAPRLQPGDHVGRYLVLDLMGAGAMGDVHAAYDPELDRAVALKVLRAEGEREGEQSTLAREARALGQLNHPNVVTIYDVGTWEGRLFIAMELVKGPTLRAWAASDHAWAEVVAIGIDVARGLAAAHAAGIVHRDLKPSNILVDHDGRARVTDFGLAAFAGLGDAGVVAGTPVYMAPEQHRAARVDARADQYSLCVLLFEILFGRRPFAESDLKQLVDRKERGRVNTVDDAWVPGRVTRALVRGLRPDPADRWPSMTALLGELEATVSPKRSRTLPFVAAAGIAGALGLWLALPTGAPCPAPDHPWSASHKAEVSARFVETGAPYADRVWAQVEQGLDDYTARWVELSLETCESVRGGDTEDPTSRELELRQRCLHARHRELDALVDVLTQADLKVVEQAPQAVSGLRSLEHCTDDETLALWFDVPPAEIADEVERLRDQIARVEASRWSGDYAAAGREAAEVLAAAKAVDYPPLVAEAHALRGAAEHRAGDFAAAAEHLQIAAWLAMSLHHDGVAASTATELTYVVGVRLADARAAHRWARLAESAATGPRGRARLHSVVGAVLSTEARFEEALERHRAARALIDELPNALYESAVESSNIGAVFFSLRRYDEALNEFSRALRHWEASVGGDHPQMAIALNNRGNTLVEQGRHDEARADYERALEIALRALGATHPRTALTIGNLGYVALRQRRADAARHHLERALALVEHAFGPSHPHVANVLQNLGDTALLEHDCALALTHFERASSIRDETLPPDHPHRAWTLTGLGRAHLCSGAPARAVPLLERALAHRQAHDPAPRRLASTRFALAQAIWDDGHDPPRARRLAQTSLEEFATLGPQASTESAEVARWLEQR